VSEDSRAVRRVLWALALAFVLHEAEEWNLVAWEREHFVPPPQIDDLAVRTLLVAFATLALVFTAAALRFLSLRGALLALLPFYFTIVFGNALTHVFWLFYFRAYAPGVVTSALLLVPLTALLATRVLRERLAPAGYALALLALAPLQPLGAAAAGKTLSGAQLALQRLAAGFAAWLWDTT
jgi:hypothetical protein